MRTPLPFLAPFACLLAACGPSEGEGTEAERVQSARAAAQSAGPAEAPVDLGEGLMLTVLERGTGAFVASGGRVRVHYDASVVAVSEAPVAAAPAEETPVDEGAPAEDAAVAPEVASEPAAETTAETLPEPAPVTDEAAPQTPPAADETTRAPLADVPAESAEEPAAAAAEVAPEVAAAAAEPAFPRRFDSSRARGVPDTWDLSRTASPRLIDGLRRGMVGLTAGSRVTLRVPAALAWGDAGLPDAGVPARADVLYEIELIEVLP